MTKEDSLTSVLCRPPSVICPLPLTPETSYGEISSIQYSTKNQEPE